MESIKFSATISDSKSAIRRSGSLSGGGCVTIDVPESDIDKLAALMSLVLIPLRIEVSVSEGDDLMTTVEPRRKSKRAAVIPVSEPVVDEPVKSVGIPIGTADPAIAHTFKGQRPHRLPRPDTEF